METGSCKICLFVPPMAVCAADPNRFWAAVAPNFHCAWQRGHRRWEGRHKPALWLCYGGLVDTNAVHYSTVQCTLVPSGYVVSTPNIFYSRRKTKNTKYDLPFLDSPPPPQQTVIAFGVFFPLYLMKHFCTLFVMIKT